MTWLLLAAFVTGVPEGNLLSQWPESLYMHSTWQWNRGTVQTVEHHGGLEYCGAASSILTLRGSALLSRTDLPGIAQDLLVESDHIYVAAGNAGLVVISLANPEAPEIQSALDLPGYAWSLSKNDSLLLVASKERGLFAIDVSRPEQPHLLAQRIPCDTVNAAVIAGGYAWLAAGRSGLIVLDARAPYRLDEIARLPLPGSAQGVTIRDTFAWVSCGDSGTATVSIANPSRPRAIRHDAWGGAQRITILDSLAAIAAGADGVCLVNIGYPDQPYLYDSLSIANSFVQDVAFDGDTMCIAAGPAGRLRFKIRDPFLPEPIDTLQQPGYTRDIAVETSATEAVAWVVTSSGLYAVNLESPANPDLGFCSLRPAPYRLALVPGAAAVLRGANSVVFVSTSDPAHPVIIDSLAVPGTPAAVAARDSWIWIGTADSEIRVVVRGPSGPARLAGSVRLPGSVFSLRRTGNLLTAVVDSNGVCFCDVTSPQDPVLESYLTLPVTGQIRSACTRDSLAAACGDGGLWLIDVANPGAPSLIRHSPLAASGWRLELLDTLCYIAEDWAGVVVFNVARPNAAWSVAYCAGPSVVHSLAMDGINPIGGDVYSGLLKMELDLPYSQPVTARAASLLAQSVIATASATVKVPALNSPGTLNLFDPSGRRISQLAVPANSSAQEFQFPTDPLGAGVYFARLESPGQVLTARIHVVR